jgi:polyisoprenoid-binding protein YceI
MPFRLFTLVAAAGLLASAAWAQAPAAKLVPTQSEIGFVSKQLGVPVEGKFRTFDAQIAFDPKKPETGSVAFTIDTGSATIGDKETDAEMTKAPWFAVAKFPTASFKSTAIKSLGSGKYEVAGTLTIKGNTQPVVVPISVTQTGANSTAVGGFTMKRIDFKIGEGEWSDTSMVANEVQVKFKLTLTGLNPL